MNTSIEDVMFWDALIFRAGLTFYDHRMNNNKVWLTIEHEEVAISDMPTEHIHNAIKMLERSIITDYSTSPALKGLKQELQLRLKIAQACKLNLTTSRLPVVSTRLQLVKHLRDL